MLSAPEQELLEMLKYPSSQHEGFRILVSRYQERLYRHIRGMVGTHENTDDVLQNTFIKIFKGIEGFNGDSSLYSWFYRIATNESLSFLKKNKKMIIDSIDDESKRTGVNLYAAAPLQSSEEMQSLLLKAIDSLPPKQRQVFEFRYFEDLSYEEISKRVGTSIGGLKASFFHASNKVEEFIKNNAL